MERFHILSLQTVIGGVETVIHPVVIIEDDGLILFDAGYPKRGRDFEDALARIGFSVADIKRIVISHHDHDHVGSLRELKDMNAGIEVCASEAEAAIVSGKEKSLRLAQAEKYKEILTGDDRVFGEQYIQYLRTICPCPVDRVLRDGEYAGAGVRVVMTPGHTPGHISLYLEEENVLLAGDALAVENGELVLANPQFTLDMDEALRSVQKIMELHAHEMVCYHGGLFSQARSEE